MNFFSDDEAFYVWVIDGEAKLLVQDLSRDINQDGKVNALDLLVLRKKLVDLPIEGSFDPVAADLNKDGNIDILDLVRLRKILGSKPYEQTVKYTNSLSPPEASPQEGFFCHLAHCLPVLS